MNALPKWPALVVVGEPITREQAMLVIVRTDRLSVSTNDGAWAEEVRSIFGLIDTTYFPPDHPNKTETDRQAEFDERMRRHNANEAVRASLGCLDLAYLRGDALVFTMAEGLTFSLHHNQDWSEV